MKRLRSGIARMTSTTLRSSRRKSPACSGILSLAQPIVRAIIKVGGEPLGQAVALAIVAHAIDDVEALAPFGDHRRDRFGRVLQVDVDRDHRQPAGMVEPGRQRRFLAEIARQRQRPDARIGGRSAARITSSVRRCCRRRRTGSRTTRRRSHRAPRAPARRASRNAPIASSSSLTGDDRLSSTARSCVDEAAMEREGQAAG